MKNIYAGILAIGMAVGGYIYANKTAKTITTRQDQYRIEQTDTTTNLYSKNLNKSYELTSLDGNLFLGDVQHNMLGVTKLSAYEAKESMMPVIDKLSSKIDSLESRIDSK